MIVRAQSQVGQRYVTVQSLLDVNCAAGIQMQPAIWGFFGREKDSLDRRLVANMKVHVEWDFYKIEIKEF